MIYSEFLQQGIHSFFPISLPSGKFPFFGDTTDHAFSYDGMFCNVSTAVAPGDFQITYRDTSSATSDRDLRLWMTDSANATVNVGRSPVPAREHVTPPSHSLTRRIGAIAAGAAGPRV